MLSVPDTDCKYIDGTLAVPHLDVVDTHAGEHWAFGTLRIEDPPVRHRRGNVTVLLSPAEQTSVPEGVG